MPLGHAHALGQVAQRVVRARLVGDDVDRDAAGEELGEHRRGVADEADAERRARLLRGEHAGDRVVEVVGHLVEVAVLDAALQARGIHVDDEHHALVHGDRERLRAAHAAAAAGERQRAGEGAVEPGAGDRAEGLVRALQDALRADVDPRSGGHLAVHGEAELLEPAELGPRRPVAHEVRVGDEHARRPLVGAEDADGLARLHEQRLVGLEVLERAHDRVERLPVAGGLAGAAVDDEVLGALGDLGVEVVHEHAQGRLGLPALRGELGAARGADGARGSDGCVGHASITPHAASVDNGCGGARVRDPETRRAQAGGLSRARCRAPP